MDGLLSNAVKVMRGLRIEAGGGSRRSQFAHNARSLLDLNLQPLERFSQVKIFKIKYCTIE